MGSTMQFERQVDDLLSSMRYKTNRNPKLIGRSGTLHRPDIVIEKQGRTSFLNARQLFQRKHTVFQRRH